MGSPCKRVRCSSIPPFCKLSAGNSVCFQSQLRGVLQEESIAEPDFKCPAKADEFWKEIKEGKALLEAPLFVPIGLLDDKMDPVPSPSAL